LPISRNAKSYIKRIAYAFLGVIAAVLGVLAVGSFGDYFTDNPIHTTIKLSPSLGIDTFGAVLPIILALAAMAFLKTSKKVTKTAVSLVTCVALAFVLCHPTDEGIAVQPLFFSLISAAIITVVNVFSKPFAYLRKNLVKTLMLNLTCTPISLFAVDVYYSAYYPNSIIGGYGLSDGILMSTLYAPLSVVGVFSVLTYISQTVWLINKKN
jgi:hypothetical protein